MYLQERESLEQDDRRVQKPAERNSNF